MSKKIALVTGNHKGLGKAISERLLELDYEKPLEVRSKDFDLTKSEDCQALVSSVVEKYGRLDLLVNNVGDYKKGYIDDCSVEDWHAMLDSNLNSAFYMSKYAIEHLRKTQGKLINIGLCGIGKLSPPAELMAYQVAKTGLLALTKTMAKAEATRQVTVNMISPGSLENSIEGDSALPRIPMGRLGGLDEVVRAVEFIVLSDYVTGQNLEVAGARGL